MTRLWPEGETIHVWGAAGLPEGFTWRGTPHKIDQVCNRWRVHTRGWEPGEVVYREYFKVATESGYLCLIYHDLLSEAWFLSRLYD